MHTHTSSLGGKTAQGRNRLEVADIFRAHGEAYRKTHALTDTQRKVMRAIEACRTQVLGGHLDVCPKCGETRPSYNSCRNRHCPKCQALKQAKWIIERQARILPTHYFHVVCTVPHILQLLALENPRRFYTILIRSAANTLLELGRDSERLGAQLGITCVLHTWTRDLRLHPHVHCIVTGGGLSPDGKRWISANRRYLFPVKVISKLFRGKMIAAIETAWKNKELTCQKLSTPVDFAKFKRRLKKDWVTYAKAPFGGPKAVFNYLGRYTHRIAISNQRLISMNKQGVSFVTRGQKTATISPECFIGRFLQHVLPDGFVKIRHFGLLSAGNVNTKLPIARRLLEPKRQPLPKLFLLFLALFIALYKPSYPTEWQAYLFLIGGINLSQCPKCGTPMQRMPLPTSFLDSS